VPSHLHLQISTSSFIRVKRRNVGQRIDHVLRVWFPPVDWHEVESESETQSGTASDVFRSLHDERQGDTLTVDSTTVTIVTPPPQPARLPIAAAGTMPCSRCSVIEGHRIRERHVRSVSLTLILGPLQRTGFVRLRCGSTKA